MDINRYIESGILELYALGLLTAVENEEVERLLAIYGELGEELEKIYIALEDYAKVNSIEPRQELSQKLLDRIENAQKEQKMDPKNLPLITPYSDLNCWLNFTKPMMKEFKNDDQRAVKILTHTKTLTQLLLKSTTDFEWETHDDEYERFLILSGEALCTVGDNTTLMGVGDFMEIPLHVPHSVKLISPVVTAILQRQKV